MKKLFVALFVWSVVLCTHAKKPELSPINWEARVASLHNLARAQKINELKAALTKWRLDFEGAPCEAKVSWVLLAINIDLPGTDRADLMHELKNLRRCSASKQLNNVHTAIGADYYELGIFDSAFHSFSDAFEVAFDRQDTNEMVLSLSNMAALYSEMDWKVEALATALRAYSLAQSSSKISALTNLFLVNNVASLQMDMGYFDQAAKVLYGVDIEEDKFDEGQIHVLRAVNFARLKIQESEGSERKIRAILERLETSPAAFMMASSFAVADSLCPQSVLIYIHEEFRLRQKEFMADTATFVSFGIPALGGISLILRIDESLRLSAFSLRDYVTNLPLGTDRLGYKLGIAQMFEIPDYWEDYWRETELIKQRDRQYARLQNKILSDFNEQVQLETSALMELEGKRNLVQLLIIVASCLLGIAVGLLFWVNGRYKTALKSHKYLTAENDRLAKGMLSQVTYFDELKELLRKSRKTVRKDSLNDLVARMEQSLPQEQLELPESILKEYDLTATETKVLIQLAYGYRNAEIVQMLNISKSYIHNVRSKLRQKLPLNPDEELEDFAVALRKSYEPTSLPESARFSR